MPPNHAGVFVAAPWHPRPRHTWRPTSAGIPLISSGFSEAAIIAVYPPEQVGAQWYFSWLSVAPPGTWYQLYFDQNLVWVGQTASALVPAPTNVQSVNIGTVGAGNEYVDYSADLPAAIDRFALLSWQGGTFESPDIAGFYVYSTGSPGGPIDYSAPLTTIVAYPGVVVTDGFGMGGFGDGGFGEAAATYTYTAGPLLPGTWSFAVIPFDSAGNKGPASTVEIEIDVPPLEPALFSDGTRLHYTYNDPTITLNWNASPG
jgi:hypothetical protein